ncbi:MAG TPA: CDP-glucose 4,6-dehydratase [Thermoanaerobaculia bacterium]|jgi:CDP-glucose 4,6-dehydratase
MALSSPFWRGKKVLITGHTGFKGSWLSLWLRQLGADVTGFALEPPTAPSLFADARVSELMSSVHGDVRDLAAVQAAVAAAAPDVVFHMAAQPLVRTSYTAPVETYATNVMGTVHLLEAVRSTPTTRVLIVVTSDKCYENREWVWGYREHDPMGGHDPYSNSKGCAELVTAAYRQSFFSTTGTAVATVRAGNVIGGGDWAADRLIPDVIRSIAAGSPVLIRNPRAIRPWQHVLDPLSGYLLLAERLWEGGGEHQSGWNFGPSDTDAKPVSSIVEELCAIWGDDAKWSMDGANHPHEAHYLKLDCSKAQAELGWMPRLHIRDALQWTAAWYKAYLQEPSAARDITAQQIEAYGKLVTHTPAGMPATRQPLVST